MGVRERKGSTDDIRKAPRPMTPGGCLCPTLDQKQAGSRLTWIKERLGGKGYPLTVTLWIRAMMPRKNFASLVLALGLVASPALRAAKSAFGTPSRWRDAEPGNTL